jgi:hypothetical protein
MEVTFILSEVKDNAFHTLCVRKYEVKTLTAPPPSLCVRGMDPHDTHGFMERLIAILMKSSVMEIINQVFDQRLEVPTLVATILVGDMIVYADMLNNLTAYHAHPDTIRRTLASIEEHVRTYIPTATSPPAEEAWRQRQLETHTKWRELQVAMAKN